MPLPATAWLALPPPLAGAEAVPLDSPTTKHIEGEYPHRACTARAPCAHRVRYLNNFSRRWSTGRGVVDGTCWALRRYHSP